MEVPIAIEPDSGVKAGTPSALFQLPAATYQPLDAWLWDVTPDGQRFLTVVPITQDVGPLAVVVNWETRLRRKGAGQ